MGGEQTVTLLPRKADTGHSPLTYGYLRSVSGLRLNQNCCKII